MSLSKSKKDLASSVIEKLIANLISIQNKSDYEQVDSMLSTTEIFILLQCVGDTFTQTETHQLLREYLLADKVQSEFQSNVPEMDSREYVNLVDTFLEDLSRYSVPSELGINFANALHLEIQNELKQSFLNRMTEAKASGILSNESIAKYQQMSELEGWSSIPGSGSGTLLATLLALSFSGWMNAAVAKEGHKLKPHSSTTTQKEPIIINDVNTQQPQDKKNPDVTAFSQQLPRLLNSLDSNNPETRAEALDLLAMHGKDAKPALPKLVKNLQSQDPMRRCEAAWAIAYISTGADADVQALQAALDDRNERVSKIAALALGNIGSAAKNALPALKAKNGNSYSVIALDCINSSSKLCLIFLRRESLSLQLMLEKSVERRLEPMGICMCSLA